MAFDGLSYHHVASGAFVIDYKQRLLVIHEKRHREAGVEIRLTIPGGIVENCETLIEAVIREVKEETNYDIQILGLLSVYNWVREVEWMGLDEKDGIDFFFGAKLVGGSPIPQLDEGISSILWMTRESIQTRLEDFPPGVNVLKLYDNLTSGKYLESILIDSDRHKLREHFHIA